MLATLELDRRPQRFAKLVVEVGQELRPLCEVNNCRVNVAVPVSKVHRGIADRDEALAFDEVVAPCVIYYFGGVAREATGFIKYIGVVHVKLGEQLFSKVL